MRLECVFEFPTILLNLLKRALLSCPSKEMSSIIGKQFFLKKRFQNRHGQKEIVLAAKPYSHLFEKVVNFNGALAPAAESLSIELHAIKLV